MAITAAIEELRQGLKFESTISSKIFFGQDAAKESDDNLALQIRMLEDELHRKKIQWSKLRHGNAKIIDDISESRLRKTKCGKVAVFLEEEFKGEQDKMEVWIDGYVCVSVCLSGCLAVFVCVWLCLSVFVCVSLQCRQQIPCFS